MIHVTQGSTSQRFHSLSKQHLLLGPNVRTCEPMGDLSRTPGLHELNTSQLIGGKAHVSTSKMPCLLTFPTLFPVSVLQTNSQLQIPIKQRCLQSHTSTIDSCRENLPIPKARQRVIPIDKVPGLRKFQLFTSSHQ